MGQSSFCLEEGFRLNFLVSLTQTFFVFMVVRKVEETEGFFFFQLPTDSLKKK